MENDHNKHTRAGDPRYEFRLEPRLKGPFEAQIKNLGIIKQALFEGWVEEWVKQPDFVPRPLVDPGAINLRGLVARSLADRITQGDAAWIDDAIVEAVRGLGIGSIFGKRFDHYIEEKRFLSKKFSPWLLDRIVSLLRSGRRVCLLADSGVSKFGNWRK